MQKWLVKNNDTSFELFENKEEYTVTVKTLKLNASKN